MDNVEKRLAEQFSCLKCRGRQARVQAVVLPMARIWAIFSGQVSPKFYVASCTLCGFSEFYDSMAYASQRDAAQAEDELAPEAGS